MSFFFNDTATTEIYTLSLHDALPICQPGLLGNSGPGEYAVQGLVLRQGRFGILRWADGGHRQPTGEFRTRSEEHTSELQSLAYLVCRLLLEKKKHHRPKRGPRRSHVQ